MRKSSVSLVACLIIMSLSMASAGAAVIGSYTIQAGTSSTYERDYRASVSIGEDMSDVEGRTFIFNGRDEDAWIDSGNGIPILENSGSTFWIASDDDDPDFSLFVSRITDGVPDNVQAHFARGSGGGFSYWVPIYIVRGWPDTGDYNFDHADLNGYAISRIGLTINWATYSYVSGAQYPHQYEWEITYTFEGEPVPEPASALALSAGIGGFGILRFRRRRK